MIHSNRKSPTPHENRDRFCQKKPRVDPGFEPGPLMQKSVALLLALPPGPTFVLINWLSQIGTRAFKYKPALVPALCTLIRGNRESFILLWFRQIYCLQWNPFEGKIGFWPQTRLQFFFFLEKLLTMKTFKQWRRNESSAFRFSCPLLLIGFFDALNKAR